MYFDEATRKFKITQMACICDSHCISTNSAVLECGRRVQKKY